MGEWVPVFLSETKGDASLPAGEEGLQNSLEPSGHVLSPGEGVHPEKHFNMSESASFLAKKKKHYGAPGEISVRLSEGLPETVKSGPWG